MTEEQRKSFWNIVAPILQVIGAIAAFTVAAACGHGDSLDLLLFLVPVYAAFNFFSAIAAGLAILRGERRAPLSWGLLVGGVILCFLLFPLIRRHWDIGLEYWRRALTGGGS